MKFKKVLGYALSLCMVVPTIPVFAEEAQAVATRVSDGYVINDQFATGVDGWIAGEVNAGMDKATLSNVASYTDRDGVTANGVMKIEFTGNGGDWNSNTNQTVHKDFETPYTYQDGKKVVVKTRILQTGSNDKSTFSFLHNRPNTAETGVVPGGYPNANPYNAIRSGAYYYNDYLLFYAKRDASSSDLRYGKGYNPSGNILNTSTSDNLTNRWIDVKMIIDGKNNTMTMTATSNGVTEVVENVSIKQDDAVYRNKYGTDASGNPNKTFFDALESLTIQQRNSSNTVYVDCVQVYELNNQNIVNDQFETGVDGWIAGEVNSGMDKATLSNVASYTDRDGVTANGVMKIDFTGNGGDWNSNTNQTVHKNFDAPYTYQDGKKVVVKTRILQTGSNDKSTFSFLHNRPNTAETGVVPGNYPNANPYNAIRSGAYYYNDYLLFYAKRDASSSDLRYGKGYNPSGNILNTSIADNLTNRWIDVEMVIDGKNNTMTMTASANGVTAVAENVSIKQDDAVYRNKYGTDASGNPNKTFFDALESLTIQQRNSSNTVYVDYVQVYEYKTEVSINVNSTYKPGEAIKVTFETEKADASFKDCVDVYDAKGNKIEAVNTIDSTNKVVTITPVKSLKDGEDYYVEINTDKFPADYKIDETKKFFRVSSYIMDNQFTSGTTEGWVVGAIDTSKTSPAKISAVESYTDANGVTADGVLKVDIQEKPAEYNVGGQPNIYKALETPYVYNNDTRVVVKTRVLHTSEGYGRFDLMHNRKNTIDTDTTGNSITDNSYSNHYVLFDVRGDYNNVSYPSSVSGNEVKTTEILKTSKIANKWIDVEMVIDGKNDKMVITTTVDGVTETAVSSIKQPKSVYIRQYGATAESKWTEPPQMTFDALESLTFLQRTGDDTLYIDYVEVYEENLYSELTDSEGNVILNLEEGKTVYPKFVMKPNNAESKSYYVMSAMFVGGKLKETHVEKITTTADKYVDPVGYTLGDDIRDVVIKTFIWDADTQKPLCDAKVYEDNYQEVYVATAENGGDDANGKGTLSAPFATIEKAIQVASNTDSKIIVGGGNYYVDKTINVNSSKKLYIKAADGETPVVTAGIEYDLADAVKVTDSSVTSKLVNQNVAGNLYELDLTTKVDLDDIPPVAYPGSYDINSYLSESISKTTCDVILGEKGMTVARYPNNSYISINDIKYEADVNSWEENTDGFRIGYDSSIAGRAAKWASAVEGDSVNQPLMYGYWNNNWATQSVPMTAVDTANKVITSGHASLYGVSEGQRYYVYNLLEEIDEPYEYFIDRTTGKLYFYKPENVTDNTPIVLTLKKDVLNITADDAVINGININGTSANAIVIKADGVKIENCKITNSSARAINAEGNDIVINNCVINNVNGGIKITGGNLEKLQKSNNVISNCEISNFSTLYKTYRPAISLNGVGNTAKNNLIYDAEHMAIGFGGCLNTVEKNEIYNVCKEVDDAGAIYVGRSWIERGNKIVNNYIHDLKSNVTNVYGIGAIFLDDHYAGGYIEGNVFENIDGPAVRGNGGREHTITNNVFVKCDRGVLISDASTDTNKYTTQMTDLKNSYYRTEIWKNAFPELYNIENNYPYENRDNVMTKNVFYSCVKSYKFDAKVTQYLTNQNNYDVSVLDISLKTALNNRKYTAETMSGKISDFKTINFASIGRNKG